MSRTFEIESLQSGIDTLPEIQELKKQPADNQTDSAREILSILRDDPEFAELDDTVLREMVARWLCVAPVDLFRKGQSNSH